MLWKNSHSLSLLQKNKKHNVHAIVFGKHNYNSLKLQRKREILATSPNEIKFYTQLGKTLENLPEDKKEAVYNSLIYYQDLFEKFQRKAIERGDEAMADKFVPLIHNVLHIHGMKTLQQTLLDNVDAGMFLSPKRFFRNKKKL